MAIKGALDNYHSRTVESFSSILLFSDSKSALQAILRGNPQLTQDKLERTCTLQWIPALVDIFGDEQVDNLAKNARNSPQLFPIALPLLMLMQ
ncbi:hypothetical protein TNCV_3770321 [Trichonephila clavipes]|nr:hypothetical protein TNCV_3770321 [Trichonephila clavipes]